MPALLERQAGTWGPKPLVRTAGAERTYAEMRDAAAAQAGGLAREGVEPGDRVAVMCENRIDVLDLWLGCAWLGAVLVPINTAFRGAQLEHVLAETQPRLVVAEPGLRELVGGRAFPARGSPVESHAVAPGDTAAVLFTSGTTGPSKGVVCPHAQWYWWGILTSELLELSPEDVLYTNLPLFHTNALNAFCQALVSGATFVLGPRFSASRFWDRLRASDATVTYLLGAMVGILSKGVDDRDHRVRRALAPGVPQELVEPFRARFGVRLLNGWGSTETNLVIADDGRPGSMGRLLDEFEARVEPDGELVLRSRVPFAFATGYLGGPPFRDWFRTGDRVAREADGSFRFLDRLQESIRRRGENISAFEVEAVLAAHPHVAAAAVVPVPSELGEDEVLACVIPRAGSRCDPEELVRFCEGRIAAFAVPRYVELVAELPLTASGKVAKHVLRERGVTSETWDRERAARASK